MQIDIRPAPASTLNNFKATGGLKTILLSWVLPPAGSNYSAAQIWVNTVNDEETATLLDTVSGNNYTYQVADNNSRYFWIRSVDSLGRPIGVFTGPASASALTGAVSSTDLADGAINLASNKVVGQLAAGKVTGLGALAVLDTVGIAKVTGLGALATKDAVDAKTQITNLGDLAYADSIAANQVGAGVLAAGVVYAGEIDAAKIVLGGATGTLVPAINAAATSATGVSLSSSGQLIGPAGGGQVETLPVKDGARTVNYAPRDYGVVHVKEFKQCSSIGISTGATWCTLETMKPWHDNSGGNATQWAYVSANEVWKRSGGCGDTAWGDWIRDLDRSLYTGDLNASYGADASNLNVGIGGKNLIPHNSLPNDGSIYSGGGGAGYSMGYAGPTNNPSWTVYSPNSKGCVYMHVADTPPASQLADLYMPVRITVTAGTRYEAGVTLSTHRCLSRVLVAWYDSNNTEITEAWGNPVDHQAWSVDVPGPFPRSVLTVNAPAGAVTAMIFVRQYHTGADNDPYTFASQWYFGEALPNQTVGSPWTPSPTETLDVIAAIGSDNVLHRGVKSQVIADWAAIQGEFNGIQVQADNLGVGHAAFDSAYVALFNYLAGLNNPWWNDTTQDTAIDGPTFRANFTNYYTAKQALSNAIYAKAATTANWVNVNNRPSDDAIRNNMIDLSWWARDAAIPWQPNNEYNRIITVGQSGSPDITLAFGGPKGGTDTVWFTQEVGQTPVGTDANSSGGWNDAPVTLDPTKTYRFVVPVCRLSGVGTAWWGGRGICSLNTTNVEGNPYFVSNFNPTLGRWYLLVGYVYPAGSTGHTNDGAGAIDCATGQWAANGSNWTFAPGGGSIFHRAYQFYAENGAQQLFGRPMINLVDGTEPSLREYFNATAVLNSQQQWGDVSGTGRPADNATVGAPSGTMVGGMDAGLVASYAANGNAANNALQTKLNKAGTDAITGQISLQAAYALLVGTPNDGIYYGSSGLVGRRGGATTFAIGADGSATFSGSLQAASGTLGSLTLAAGGSIKAGAYTQWGFPPAGTTGFYLGPEGLLLGNYNDGSWFLVDNKGNVRAAGLDITGGVMTLSQPVISSPQINNPTMDSFTVSLSGAAGGHYANGSAGYGGYTANPVGGKAPYTYSWTMTAQNYGSSRITMSNSSGSYTNFSGSGTNTEIDASVTCIVTDSNGRTATLNTSFFVIHGTPP